MWYMSSIVTGFLISMRDIVTLLPFHKKISSKSVAAIIRLAMTFISATRLRIRSIWFLPAFFYYAVMSAKQARQAAGNLGMVLLNDANRTFWTCTAWTDESAMRAFMMDTP